MPMIRETAYNTLVRPQLEYSSAVLDPYTKYKINQIEMVQRRAARQTNRAIGIINFERLSPNFIADTMNWFLNSMLD